MRVITLRVALIAAVLAHVACISALAAPSASATRQRGLVNWGSGVLGYGRTEFDPHVIIIVADTATWEDYTSSSAPFMREWLKQCAVGLMNSRVQGLPTPAAAYLTLGAGSRAAAELDPELAELALNHDERYGDVSGRDVFQWRSGTELGLADIGYLGLPSVLKENAQAMYSLRLGLLGETLQKAGLKAAAIGNADLPDRYSRQIATIVMDEAGRVAAGDVGPRMCRVLSTAEPAVSTDYKALESAFNRVLTEASVIAVETGDLSRISAQADLLMPEVLAQRRREAIAAMDAFVRRVVERMKGRPWRLFLVTPSAFAMPEQRADVLTPIAAWGKGISRGLLTSPSTRRPGVVGNVDLAPSVLDFLHVEIPPEAIGRPMTCVASAETDAVAHIMRVQEQQARLEANRPYVLNAASAAIVAVFALAAVALILGGPLPEGAIAGLREAALLIVAFPLGALLVPAYLSANPAVVLAAVTGVTVAAYLAARSLARTAPPYAWLTGAFTLALCLDMALGQRLIRPSALGYSVTGGARYYGVGNELGGALIATAPIAIAAWCARNPNSRRRLVSALILALIVIVIGHPAAGSKWGIAGPAALGFGLTILGLYRVRLTVRSIVIALAAAAIALSVVLAINWPSPGANLTHIGLAIKSIQRGGLPEMAQIFSRRMARNLVLVRHSTTTWILVSALVVAAAAAIGRSRALSEHLERSPLLAAGLIGAAVASVVSFVVNDAGVAAAAWGFAVISGTMMYVVFDWRLRQGAIRLD